MLMLKLYGADVCPFVHRVRLVLEEKELPFDYVAIDLRNKPDWYYEVLPSGKVPLLEDGPHRIWESSIICEYLEERYPQPPLMPQDPGPRAQARIWISWLNDSFVPAFYAMLTRGGEEERHELEGLVKKLDSQALAQGDWIMGARPSLVDLQLYPWIERWPVLKHFRDFEFPLELERLAAWRGRLESRQSVLKLAQPRRFYIDSYARYATVTV